MVVGLVSLTFFFSALVLAFGLRIGEQRDWQTFRIPDILWFGTAVLVASSALLEAARYSLRRALVSIYRLRIALAVLLAVIFLCIQAVTAANLWSQGVSASANPRGSAFYIFMGIHAAHLVVGMGWLGWLWLLSGKLKQTTEQGLRRQRRTVGAAAMFWHFMGALWLVLFFFLRRWTAA